jgi:signal transduction histidine kinase
MSTDKPSPLRGRWPLILAGLTTITGICLSVYLRERIAQTETDAARLTAETLRLNTEQELTLFAEVLESVCALHALSDAVDQAAMDEFIEKGLIYQHAVLGAFGLTQQINPWLRADIEGKDKNQPGAYQVLQQGPDGTWIPAEQKPVYYPLTWQSRINGLKIPVGFDFSSMNPEAVRTIEQIENTRRPALVPAPVRNQDAGIRNQAPEVGIQGSETENQQSKIGNHQSTIDNLPSPAFWVFAPVTPRPIKDKTLYFPPNAVIGFAVAVLHPEVILNRIAARTMPSSELRLNLMGPSGPEAEKTIRLANGTWLYRSPLEAIGTQWIFECSLPASATGHRSSAALAIGLFITALVTSQLLLLANRTRRIEAEVHARTEDLRVANTRLEENFRERARLEEEMHELAAREQRRIGRDLHDSLGQKLTGAVFLSRSLLDYFSNSKNQGSGDGDQRSEVGRQSEIVNRKSSIGNQETHARTLNETLKDAVAQVRNMARGLAPVTLNDESLCEALSQLAEEMTGLYGVSCEVTECTEPPALDRKIKEQLYLIAREAVNNAARHAQAGHVTLRLTGSESGWKLCVEDDGKGLAEKQPSDEGMGIRIMRHRASLIGADFSISSASGQGTCVDVISNM